MKTRFKAVIFDCDGLLLDTEHAFTIAERDLCARYGRTYGDDEKRLLLGSSFDAAGRIFESLLDQPGRATELSGEFVEILTAHGHHAAPARPGARELVSALAGKLPLAVVSNTPRRALIQALREVDFNDQFQLVLGGDEVTEPKPAPDLYLHACELLHTAPANVAAFEDSATGVASARAAGVFVVGVPYLPDTPLDADIVTQSLLDPTLLGLLGILRSAS
jgi:HAD superfamily hydrolase (TIGR01509 family)